MYLLLGLFRKYSVVPFRMVSNTKLLNDEWVQLKNSPEGFILKYFAFYLTSDLFFELHSLLIVAIGFVDLQLQCQWAN